MQKRNVTTPISFFIALLIFIVNGLFSGVEEKFQTSTLIFFSFLVVILTVINVKYGIHWLIYAMLLSPEFVVNWIPIHHRQFVIRIDDLMIVLIGLTWFMQLAIKGQLHGLVRTPMNKPILLFVFICILSTAKGVIAGSVPYPMTAFFTVLKFVEFYLLYFLIVNNIDDLSDVKSAMTAFILTMIVVVIYGTFSSSQTGRATTPFEAVPSPATLGGYLIICFALMFSFFLHSRTFTKKIVYLALALATIPPLIFSLSRGSYMAFIPMVFGLIFFTEKKWIPIVFLIMGVVTGPMWLPQAAVERINYTFQGRVENEITGEKEMVLDPSSQARLDRWNEVVEVWEYFPIMGAGMTSVGLVDSQVMRVVGELGILGIISMGLLFYTIISRAWRVYRDTKDPYVKGLSLGLLSATSGLLLHGTTANTFAIVRIAGPYWFLVALVMVLGRLESLKTEEEKEQEEEEVEPLYSNKRLSYAE